ncbi:MGA_1079 family surface serine endopeptidase [Metamycoplasma neophronis]|uniref:DUF31 domain-containing protein n=1 Tax=Metamycoplasma neophronis TaxID=872983 RepID=A0ABY2YZC5_9BACT|nr:hypothetical protein [Metamycoplasma neophronis]TPR53383.1 hypothetical protein FJR74_02625 [Metamycoplasma neophronis]
MKKKYIKSLGLLLAMAPIAALAASCEKPNNNENKENNTYKNQLQNLENSINIYLNQYLLKNNLIEFSKLITLKQNVKGILNSNAVTAENLQESVNSFNEIKAEIDNKINQFIENKITILNDISNNLSTVNKQALSADLLSELNSQISQNQNDISSKNIEAILNDIPASTKLLTKIAKQVDDFETKKTLVLNLIQNLENELNNFIENNQNFDFLNALAKREIIIPERVVTEENIDRINSQITNSEDNLSLLKHELVALNKSNELKAYIDTMRPNDNHLSEAKALLNSYIQSFQTNSILNADELQTITSKFDADFAALKQKIDGTNKSDYSNLYSKIQAKILKLNSLPSTKNSEFSNLMSELKNTSQFNELDANAKATQLANIEAKYNQINELYPDDVIDLKILAQRDITVSLNERAGNSNPLFYNLNVNSASINDNNFDVYLNQSLVNKDIKITNRSYKLSQDDISVLEVKYEIQKNDVNTYILKEIVFDYKLQTLVDEISYHNIEDLYTINYAGFKNKYEDEFTADIQNQSLNLIKPKYSNLKQYFTYQVIKDSIAYTDNKLKFDVAINYKNNLIKKITLKSINDLSFKNPLNKLVTYSVKWTHMYHYRNPSEYDMLKLIGMIFQTEYNNADATYQFNSEDISFLKYLMQVKNRAWNENYVPYNVKKQWLNTALHKNINLNLPGYNNWEIIDLSQNEIFSYNTEDHALTFNIKFTGENKQPFTYLLKLYPLNGEQNYQKNKWMFDMNRALNNYQKILSQATINDLKVTHTNFIAPEGVKKLNEIYTLPTINGYKVIFLNQNPSDYTVNARAGFVNISLGIEKDGVIQNNPLLKSNKFKLDYFRKLNYYDIKPMNGKSWFTDEDFAQQGTNQAIKNTIAKINSRNIDYRLVNGKRMFDASVLMEEQSFDKLNFLFKFKGTHESVEDKNKEFENNNNDFESTETVPTLPTNTDDISNPSDPTNNVDMNPILNNYFVYFYDVNAQYRLREFSSTMTFKLGFINKNNWNDRYSTGTITLRNLKNDLANELYPLVGVNKLNMNDFYIRGVESLTPSDALAQLKDPNRINPLSVSISTYKYKNYAFYPDRWKIADAKMPDDKNGTLMIRLKYTTKQDKEFIGDVWYKISGFKQNNNAPDPHYTDENYLSLPFAQKMKKIFLDKNTILRRRETEIEVKDNYWELNKETNQVEYLFKKKYYEPILSQNNTDAKVKIHLSANIKFLDSVAYARVFKYLTGQEGGINLEFNYQELIQNNFVIIKGVAAAPRATNTGEMISVAYTMRVSKQDDGMKFTFSLDNPNYKIVQDNPVSSLYQPPRMSVPNNLLNTFNPNEAFFFDYFAGRISFEYKNNVPDEVFNVENTTNLISYKYMDYTQENQPLVIINKDSFDDPYKYNPNQMLTYKLHDGYKFNNEYLNKSYVKTSQVAQELMGRSFAMNRGSGMMVAKVNSDPNDGRFYAFTNHHVINKDNLNFTPEKIGFDSGTAPTVAGLNFGNNVENGFSYWDGLYVEDIKVQVVWSGIKQIGYTSSINPENATFKNNVLTQNEFVDITVFIIDTKPLIAKLKAAGKYQTAAYYENWFKIGNLNINPHLLKQSPNRLTGIENALFNGFPYGKQASYIIHRLGANYNIDSFQSHSQFVPSFYNAGNSGTGVMDNSGHYINTINSGIPLKLLVGRNGAYDLGFSSFNFFGVNKENQNPLDLINSHSLARNIMRLNAFNPDLYDLPWFFTSNKKD